MVERQKEFRVGMHRQWPALQQQISGLFRQTTTIQPHSLQYQPQSSQTSGPTRKSDRPHIRPRALGPIALRPISLTAEPHVLAFMGHHASDVATLVLNTLLVVGRSTCIVIASHSS